MTNEELQKELKDAEKKVNEGLYKNARICSYQEFLDEFIDPFLPADKQIKAGPWSRGWSKDIFGTDDPFGIIVHF